jgi:hypothetical protein
VETAQGEELENKRTGLPVEVENVDGDLVITLPDELGGGTITETEYTINQSQVTTLRQCGFQPESNSVDLEIDIMTELPKFSLTLDEYLEQRELAQAWHRRDILRILQPLADLINYKQALGQELNEYEETFIVGYTYQKSSLSDYLERNTDTEEERAAREDAEKMFRDRDELEYRRQHGLLYADGNENDTYSKRQRKMRCDRVLNGVIFTDPYRRSKIGNLTMQFLHGRYPGDIDQEWQGVAAADARSVARGVLTDEQLESLDRATRGVMASTSYEAVINSRRMQSSAAQPRQTAGDGKDIISRPSPGNF